MSKKVWFWGSCTAVVAGLAIGSVAGILSLEEGEKAYPASYEQRLSRLLEITGAVSKQKQKEQSVDAKALAGLLEKIQEKEKKIPLNFPTWNISVEQEREIKWLAKGIYFEARNQPVEGQLRVADAIMTRMIDKRWPNSVEGVVRQGEAKFNRCQFSFMCDGKPERIDDTQAWRVAYMLAKFQYRKYVRGYRIASCAHSYHAVRATNTGWFATLQREDRVGSHIFYCDKHKVT